MYDALTNKTKNKMIFNRVEKIKKLKEDISILQEKLRKLEAQQEPQMTLKKSGDCDVISYDHKYYYRLSFGVGDFCWYKRYIGSPNLMRVEDPGEHKTLEEYYEDMILDTAGVVELEKRKIDDLAEKLLPDDHPYKVADEHGETNPYKQYLNSVEDEKKMEELGFVKNDEGHWTAQPLGETEQSLKESFVEAQKTEKWKEIQKLIDEEDNDKNFKNSLDLIKEWGEKNKSKTLYQICMEWWDEVFVNEIDDDICVDVLVSKIDKEFIPPSSKKNGYEWEKCLKMMRDKLR